MVDCELIPFSSEKIGVAYYKEYINSKRWRNIRKYHFSISSNKKCKCCNSTDSLEVHHRSYDRLGGLGETKDLITLCKVCHSQLHKEQKRMRLTVEEATKQFMKRYKFSSGKNKRRKNKPLSKWNFDRKMMQRKRILDEEYNRKYG